MIILLIAAVTITAIIAYRAGARAGGERPKLRGVYFPPVARETYVAPESEGVRMFRAAQTARRVTFTETAE
jgi:hypothetical protein